MVVSRNTTIRSILGVCEELACKLNTVDAPLSHKIKKKRAEALSFSLCLVAITQRNKLLNIQLTVVPLFKGGLRGIVDIRSLLLLL